MFFPDEIITEILNYLAHQTWIDKINKVNKQYHSYYFYTDSWCLEISLICKKHRQNVANWRYLDDKYDEYIKIKEKIYPICVNSDKHVPKWQMHSQIKLPHNY